MAAVRRINHVVLYVRDLERSVAFYEHVFGFEVVARAGKAMAFLRAAGSENHHDLGLAVVGRDAPSPPPGAVGLYHSAWQVDRIEEVAAAYHQLIARDALTGASDHGATKSVYGVDPDGNEFEIMWMVPREHWGEYENAAPTRRLDLDAEVRRWGSTSARAPSFDS
jgi:catechol-2,3-dioxygenase